MHTFRNLAIDTASMCVPRISPAMLAHLPAIGERRRSLRGGRVYQPTPNVFRHPVTAAARSKRTRSPDNFSTPPPAAKQGCSFSGDLTALHKATKTPFSRRAARSDWHRLRRRHWTNDVRVRLSGKSMVPWPKHVRCPRSLGRLMPPEEATPESVVSPGTQPQINQ